MWKVIGVIGVSILLGIATWELCKIAEAAGYRKGQRDEFKSQSKEFWERYRDRYGEQEIEHIDLRG